MDLMFAPLRKYADFSGRARRLEYWLFMVLVGLGSFAAAAVDFVIGLGGPFDVGLARPIWGLFVFLPSLAVLVRRLHDIDRSGFWVLVALIPFVGGLILFVFALLDGTSGPNRYGPDPKGRRLASWGEAAG